MNLILWMLSGGLIGSTTAWFFSSSSRYAIGDIASALIGSIVFGLIAAEYMAETPVTDLNYQSFSPGALLLSTFGSVVFLTLYNWYF